MAYSNRFRSMIALVAACIVSCASFAATAAEYIHRAAVDHWPEFRPDAGTSITLDRVAHDVDVKPMIALQRAKAFLARALTHPWFTADHFDPGRAAA